jgi:hypothetical protein
VTIWIQCGKCRAETDHEHVWGDVAKAEKNHAEHAIKSGWRVIAGKWYCLICTLYKLANKREVVIA